MYFCDVSKIVVNSKILIVSGAPIRVIFQNLVTNGLIRPLKTGPEVFQGIWEHKYAPIGT